MNIGLPEKLEIETTKKDCADGVRGSERYCIVAIALSHIIVGASRIEVNIHTVRFTVKHAGKTYRVAYPTPEAVRVYIRDFDAGANAKPMRFVLENAQIEEKLPTPKGKAKTPSLKPQASAKSRRSIRVFGEKALQPVQ